MIVKEWKTEVGLDAAIVKQTHIRSMEWYCGYVNVPEGHPLHGVGYSANVKGGLEIIKNELIGKRGVISLFCASMTEGDDCDVDLLFNVHGGITFARSYKELGDGWWFGYDCNHCDDHIDIQDMEYNIAECESLAKQLYGIVPKLANILIEEK